MFVAVGCSALDKRATMKNFQMTVKETTENDMFWDESDAADSLKAAAKIRNAEHRTLAEEMAREAGNEEDDIEKAKSGIPVIQ